MSRFSRVAGLVLLGLAALAAVLVWLLVARPAGNATRVLYLAPDGDEQHQLYLLDIDSGDLRQITEEPLGIQDFAVSPDGESVVYAAPQNDGGCDLWVTSTSGGRQRLLVACAPAECSEASWSPDGDRLVYTRRESDALPELWWVTVADGETVPVFDEPVAGWGGRWSPDGAWLAFADTASGGAQLVNLNDGNRLQAPGQVEAVPVWRPDSSALLLTDLQLHGDRFSVVLLRIDLNGEQWTVLSGDGDVEDGSPAWSPDGSQIVFGRKPARVPTGRQLWLMDADGGNQRALTVDPDFHYALPSWSADGETLLYQRTPYSGSADETAIWTLDLVTGETRELASPARWPVWVP